MKNRNALKYSILGSLLIVIVIIFFLPYKPTLAFTYQNTNKMLAYIPVDMKGETFQIEYTHTIHLSDVLESYKIDENNTIHEYEFRFEEFSVGMPSNATGGEEFVMKDGKYYITNMDRIFPYLDIKIAQTIPHHSIIYNDKEYSFLDFFEPGTWTRIQSKKISLWQQLKAVNILELRYE
jgi:hypothetical protein